MSRTSYTRNGHTNQLFKSVGWLDKYWQPIERLAAEEQTNKSRVSDFIRDYLTLKNKKIPNIQKVYQEFKDTFHFKDVGSLESVLKELMKFAKSYNRLLNVENEPDELIRNQLHCINRLEINVSYPFLLQVYNDYDLKVLGRDEFIKILALIESYVWRRFIVGVPTNALNKIFMRLYEDIVVYNYYNSLAESLMKKKGSQRYPRDAEVIAALKEKDVYNIQSKNRHYLLERLENYNNNEIVQIDNNPLITVEHIFPRNPDAKWESELSGAEYSQFRDVYLNTLANLTLSGNNGSLGNKVFLEKRDMSEKGYRDSRLYLNRYLAKLDRWGLAELKARSEMLLERFLNVWPYPAIKLGEQVDYDEVSIFDADDPIGKKLEYAIFLDEKLTIHNVSELFGEVLSTLFQLDPERFFTTDLAEKMELTKEPSLLRNPRSIGDIYYVEANLNNRD